MQFHNFTLLRVKYKAFICSNRMFVWLLLSFFVGSARRRVRFVVFAGCWQLENEHFRVLLISEFNQKYNSEKNCNKTIFMRQIYIYMYVCARERSETQWHHIVSITVTTNGLLFLIYFIYIHNILYFFFRLFFSTR